MDRDGTSGRCASVDQVIVSDSQTKEQLRLLQQSVLGMFQYCGHCLVVFYSGFAGGASVTLGSQHKKQINRTAFCKGGIHNHQFVY